MEHLSPPIEMWLEDWYVAAKREDERVRAADIMFVQPELLMWAVAVGSVMLTAERILGCGHSEVHRFRTACPDAKHVRDVACHLEDYARGEGKLQKAGRARGLTVISRWGTAEAPLTSFHLFGLEIDIRRTMQALEVLYQAAIDK